MVLRPVVLLTLLALAAADYKVKILDSNTDMPTGMQQDAVTVILKAFDKFTDDLGKAKYIVHEFTRRHHSDRDEWKCIIGQFAARMSHVPRSQVVMTIQEDGFWSFGSSTMVALFQ